MKSNSKKTARPTKNQVNAALAAHIAGLETTLLVPENIKKKLFTEVEDVFLCRAYVNATQDSEKGSGQKGEMYWKTVHSNYDTLRFQEDSTVCIDDWGVDSLKNRYTKIIQKQCFQFVKFLTASKSTYQSGWGDMDYINAADLLWIDQHNKSFKHKKCMEVLCVLPKYSMDPPVSGTEVGEEEALSNPIIPVQGSTRERPMGRTKAKKRLKSELRKKSPASPSERMRMVAALEKKNELKEIAHHHRSWQQQASFWLKVGDTEKVKEYMLLLHEGQQ